jgi:hypothetical protein
MGDRERSPVGLGEGGNGVSNRRAHVAIYLKNADQKMKKHSFRLAFEVIRQAKKAPAVC